MFTSTPYATWLGAKHKDTLNLLNKEFGRELKGELENIVWRD
jgi:hypothetical protein